jgi:lipopolysaccharide/colanic/teichoic acid biosynthesis glycosyltransferase
MAKRLFDLVVAVSALAALGIPLLLVALALKFSSPGPLFFQQTRVGRHGKSFRILKFRTMEDGSERGITIGGDPRITPIGAVLRKWKIDELPQLLNIVSGDMSLVGPRPEVPEFVSKYPPAEREKVLSVRPGLTDFASIRFRNESKLLANQSDPMDFYENVLIPAKLRYCCLYVNRSSLCLDLHIMVLTAAAIVHDRFLDEGK